MMDNLVVALFLSMASNRILEALVVPIKVKLKDFDMWWLIYVSWIFGGGLAWLANINLFAVVLPEAVLVGRLLTAVVVGGGANLINDIFSKH